MHVHEVDVIYKRDHSDDEYDEQKAEAFAVLFSKNTDRNHTIFKNSISTILVSCIVY